jgi:hypothetical protein
VIGFDSNYGIVYVELADGSFMSVDFIDPIFRTGSIKISEAPAQVVAQEYVVKEMVSSEEWVEVDEIFENWTEAAKSLQKHWGYSAATARRERRHAMKTGEPVQLNVSSGPAPGLLEESTGRVTFPRGSTCLNSPKTISLLDISKSILIIEGEEPSHLTPFASKGG